jgi:dTMP kinase
VYQNLQDALLYLFDKDFPSRFSDSEFTTFINDSKIVGCHHLIFVTLLSVLALHYYICIISDKQMKLFVIEGLDGAGKSTQIKLLRDYLADMNYSCEYLHFPRTESLWFGELVARFLRGEFGSLNDVDPYLVAMLYAGDRRDASDVIAGWLNEGKIVILDRYTYSNIAYQCAKLSTQAEREKLRNWILELEFKHFGIPEPSLNIFLDVPFRFTENKLTTKRNGNDRSYLNGRNDIHESSLDFQKKVREVYLSVSETDSRLAVVQCSNPDGSMMNPDRIFEIILVLMRKRNLI